jgi:hypothetical protein
MIPRSAALLTRFAVLAAATAVAHADPLPNPAGSTSSARNAPPVLDAMLLDPAEVGAIVGADMAWAVTAGGSTTPPSSTHRPVPVPSLRPSSSPTPVAAISGWPVRGWTTGMTRVASWFRPRSVSCLPAPMHHYGRSSGDRCWRVLDSRGAIVGVSRIISPRATLHSGVCNVAGETSPHREAGRGNSWPRGIWAGLGENHWRPPLVPIYGSGPRAVASPGESTPCPPEHFRQTLGNKKMRKTMIAATAALTIACTSLFVGSLMSAPTAHADACAVAGPHDQPRYQSCVQNAIKAVQAALPDCNNFPPCVNGLMAELPAGVTLPGD